MIRYLKLAHQILFTAFRRAIPSCASHTGWIRARHRICALGRRFHVPSTLTFPSCPAQEASCKAAEMWIPRLPTHPLSLRHSFAPRPCPRFSHMMPRRNPRQSKKSDALAAAGVALRAVRDSADALPQLKSVASAVLIVVEMSKVRLFAIRIGDSCPNRPFLDLNTTYLLYIHPCRK